MKLNKKIIIPAVAVLAGISLAGSVAGTIAWYQYSTRANVSYIGTSAGTIGNLQVRLAGGEWGTQISIQDVNDYLAAQSIGQDVEPITPGALSKNDSLKVAKWQQLASASFGAVAPDDGDGDEGDYYFDSNANKLYQKGETAWAVVNNIPLDDEAPANPKRGEKYFNKADKKIYEGILKAEWKEIVAVTSDTVAPDDANGDEGDYYFDSNANKLYQKGETAWALVDDIDILAVAPANPNVGQKYFDSLENKIYEGVSVGRRDFYVNPQVGRGDYSEWIKASEDNYVTLPLQLRFIEQDEDYLKAEDVYLPKLVIQEDRLNDEVSAHGDISDAIRVHFSAYADGDEDNAVNHLVSNKGGTMLTHGKLKLGGGEDFDKGYEGDEFGFDGSDFDYVNYGGTSGAQNCYGKLVDEQDGYFYEEGKPVSGWKEINLLNGTDAPTPSLGEDGDFYYKVNTELLYLKDNGIWGVFNNAFIGTEAPNLETANPNNKDYYVQSGLNKLFLRDMPEEETISPILVENVENSLQLNKVTADKKIGTTVATRANHSAPQKYLNVDVTIWVDGWQKFARDGEFTSMWDRDLIGAKFDIGMQFAVQDR